MRNWHGCWSSDSSKLAHTPSKQLTQEKALKKSHQLDGAGLSVYLIYEQDTYSLNTWLARHVLEARHKTSQQKTLQGKTHQGETTVPARIFHGL